VSKTGRNLSISLDTEASVQAVMMKVAIGHLSSCFG
jgi:hypothetical protein